MNDLVTFISDNIFVFLAIILIIIIVILLIKSLKKEENDNIYIDFSAVKKKKYEVLDTPVGDELDVGIMPNDLYPKQDNDINNMF